MKEWILSPLEKELPSVDFSMQDRRRNRLIEGKGIADIDSCLVRGHIEGKIEKGGASRKRPSVSPIDL
ncbi:hypothetical protein OLZ32_23600 [Rhizobium sp. 1AS11]|nr:hypothetical protein [Rhizobium acaciae]